jgi:phage tail-like protein
MRNRYVGLLTWLALAPLVLSAPPAAAQVGSDVVFQVFLEIDGATTLQAQLVGGLGSEHEVVQHKIVVQNGPETIRKLPGALRYRNLELRRSATDATFRDWRNAVAAGADYQKEVVLRIHVANSGDLVAAYALHQAWPASYAVSDGDGSVSASITETVILVMDSIERID